MTQNSTAITDLSFPRLTRPGAISHILLLVFLCFTPPLNAQVEALAGGALSGVGDVLAAKELGDYSQKFSQALEQMRARAIAEANVAVAQRIDQVAIQAQILLDNINADATTKITALNSDAQSAIHALNDTVTALSKSLDETAKGVTDNLDLQINNFCQHSILCKPVYAISSVRNTFVNPSAADVKPIAVSGTALVDGASIKVVVNNKEVPPSNIAIDSSDAHSRLVTVPPGYIPSTKYNIKTYPMSISISGTIDNPDRAGMGALAFWRGGSRIPLRKSLQLSIYVLPQYPVSVSVTEYSQHKMWTPCADPTKCVQTQVMQTAYNAMPVFDWALPADRKLGDVLDWPGKVGAPDNQTEARDLSGDVYVFVCTEPSEVDRGNGTRQVESRCLDAILADRGGCGDVAAPKILGADQAARESVVRQWPAGCGQHSATNRQAVFKYTLLQGVDGVKQNSVDVEKGVTNANGTYDLGYGSYCSGQFSDAKSGYTVTVTPHLREGASPAIELSPNAASYKFSDTLAVFSVLEQNGPRTCARITVQ
jgi:hypothetical protein